ncbi:MAG: SMC-Scp complex subunit ScpB [archaeon]
MQDKENAELLKKVEAALFISARFMSVDEMVMLTNINPIMLGDLLKELKESYDGKNSALSIINKENLWKMDVKTEYHNIMARLASGKSEFSRAEQETLAIIAYKQPIKQSIIVKIRGNKAYNEIKKFIEMGLLRSRKSGHTSELELSQQFYEYFQLEKKNKTENRNDAQNEDKEQNSSVNESDSI